MGFFCFFVFFVLQHVQLNISLQYRNYSIDPNLCYNKTLTLKSMGCDIQG